MKPIGDLIMSLPPIAVEDVVSYLIDNVEGIGAADLTPTQFLDKYLAWNGLVNYSDDIIALMEKLGWRLEQPEPRIMSDEDRTKLIVLLQDRFEEELGDSDDEVQQLVEIYYGGSLGLKNMTDSMLLTEASNNYVVAGTDEVLIELLDHDATCLIWLRYAHPELLCAGCHGEPAKADCSVCKGSGLSTPSTDTKFTVIRTREITEVQDVRAKTPEYAAKLAKVGPWTTLKDGATTEVHLPEDAAEPLVPTSKPPLYTYTE